MASAHAGSPDMDNLVRRPHSEGGAVEALQTQIAALTADLNDAIEREAGLRRQKDHMLQQQALMAQEFEHRLINSLQVIVSLLSLQSRKAESPEATEQLMTAAKRVGAFERVHRQLHRLNSLDTVEFKNFVVQLCDDISVMLFDPDTPHPIVVEGAQIEIPAALGVPIGFILNELITNAVKHGQRNVMVSLETTPELGHCLSVSNGGAGLPDGFHPDSKKRLGLSIVQSLVRQINGRLQVRQDPGHEGVCFKVFFPSTAAVCD
jgi:two-component system, sensor histidine kinase PdtaS